MNRVLGRLSAILMRRRMVWMTGLILFYIVFGFFILPVIIRSVAVRQLAKQLSRPVSVRQVRVNPLTLSLTVRGLAINEKDNKPFISWDEFYANFQLSSLFRWMWTFDEIYLRAPRAQIALGPNGQLNFADLLADRTNAPPKASTSSGLPRMLVFHLVVTNGHLGFSDLSRQTPVQVAYEPVNFRLTRFTTRPEKDSPYSFEASSDSGGRLAWAGQISAQPLASSGALKIENVRLTQFAPYLQEFTRAQLAEGSVQIDGGYHFTASTNGLDLVVSNLAVNVSRLSVIDPASSELVLALPSCQLRGGQLNWLRRQGRVSSVLIEDLSTSIKRRADGTLNLQSLVLPRMTDSTTQTTLPQAGPSVSPAWTFTLDDGRLERGALEWEDAAAAQPFRTTLKPITLRIERFTTEPGKEAALKASLVTESEEKVDLTANGSVAPVWAAGRLELASLDLKKYQPYLAPFFRGQILSGKTDAGLEFAATNGTNLNETTLSNGVVRVTDLVVQPAQVEEKWIQLPSLSVESISASLAEKLLRVGSLQSTGVSVLARRETNGSINLLSLLATNQPSAPQPTSSERDSSAGSGWRVVLQELALRDYTLHLEDQQLPRPGKLKLDHLTLEARNFEYPGNQPVQLKFSTRVNESGITSVRGTAWPFKPAADAEMEVAALALSNFQPWIQPRVKLTLNRGALNLKGRLKYASPSGPDPGLHWQGDLAIANLETTDQLLFKEFVRWDELAVKGLDVGLQPNQASIRQVRFAGLRTSAILGPDKRPNWLAVWPASSEAGPVTNAPSLAASTPAASPEKAFSMQLEELAFEKAAIHFEDQSIQPSCSFDVQQFSGAIRGLSTKHDSTAQVELLGLVDESSPFGLHGSLNPLASQVSLHLTLTNQNLQLTPFNPYMEKYGGYPLHKGRLSLNLDYDLKDKALKAQNKVRVEQLMLGPRNQSPDATQLPVKLAVALLKDNEGRIELDLPVDGRLDDPQFKIAPVIFKVLGNLIVKAAASPFKLIGSLVGGGEEMSFVDFAPGESQLSELETNKLVKLVGALEKRPALSLEIEGAIDPVADRDALARRLVQEQIKALRMKELSAIGQPLPSGKSFQLDPIDSERLLRATLIQVVGTNLAESIRTLAARSASTNRLNGMRSAAKAPSLFKRWFSVFKPRQERAATLQAHRQAQADALLLKQNPDLAALSIEDMELLLASKAEVPLDSLRQLMQDRAKAVQAYLLQSGQVAAERLFLVTPKTPDASYKGEARANLSLN